MSELVAECGCVLSGFVAVMLLAAGLGKRHRGSGFATTLAAFELLPQRTVRHAARLIPWLEIGCGSALLIAPIRLTARLPAALLLCIFAAAIGINIARGRTAIDCGCSLARAGQPLRVTLVGWNMLLAALLLTPWPAPLVGWFAQSQGVLAGATLCAIAASAQALRGSPRVMAV